MADLPHAVDSQDELTLKLWEGDESAKGEILKSFAIRVERAIKSAFPDLSDVDAEDVVAEAIYRFWVYRERYDPKKGKVGTLLYKIAKNVASEHAAGRLSWQKARIREKGVEAEFFKSIEAPIPDSDPPDDTSSKPSSLQRELAACFGSLAPLQQDILRAYGNAGSYELDAATLGIELGHKHKGGVPIPGGTIRTNKSRAWDSLDLCLKKKGFDLKALGYER